MYVCMYIYIYIYSAAIKKGEEITYCYGIRSNIFLLTEYGFVLENNKYSYVNVEVINLI